MGGAKISKKRAKMNGGRGGEILTLRCGTFGGYLGDCILYRAVLRVIFKAVSWLLFSKVTLYRINSIGRCAKRRSLEAVASAILL